MDKEFLNNFLELQSILDLMKRIRRQSLVPGRIEEETDAEHSWHVALWYLALIDQFDGVDHFRVVTMLLIHDLPEILCGDAYAYLMNAEDRLNESKAAKKIFDLFPGSLSEKFLSVWMEFQEGSSREACVARAIDCLQPILQNINTDGKKWKEHGITVERLEKLKRPCVEKSEISLSIYEELLKKAAPFLSQR